MKTTIPQKSNVPDAHSSSPFFKKNQEESFFSKSKKSKDSFFDSFQIQPKLTVGQPNDKYEQEADSMADKIMKMPENGIQKACSKCEDKEDNVQPKPMIMKSGAKGSNTADPALVSQLNNSKGSGTPMSDSTNNFMSNAFNYDFSGVRLHVGNNAVQMNQSLNARAFTHKSDIYFNQGEYSPNTSDGKKLLAHELTHVVQQNGNSAIQKANKPAQNSGSQYSTSDTKELLFLALTTAKSKLKSGTLKGTTKTKVKKLHDKLEIYYVQLLRSGSKSIAPGFDTTPSKHEVNAGDASKSIQELYYPFSVKNISKNTTSQQPVLQAKTKHNISQVSQPTVQRICDPLVCLGIIILGGLLLSGCSTKSTGGISAARLAQAKKNFDKNNSHLKPAQRTKIHNAMDITTSTDLHLLIAFYDYYSNKEIYISDKEAAGGYATTSPYSDTYIHSKIIKPSFSDKTLGGLLIHEYTHTRHKSSGMGFGAYQEGDSYGIEYYYAEKNADTTRKNEIAKLIYTKGALTTRDAHAALVIRFCFHYGSIVVLQEIATTGKSSHTGKALTSLSQTKAKELIVELLSKREDDHSQALTDVISWVKANYSSLTMPFFVSC